MGRCGERVAKMPRGPDSPGGTTLSLDPSGAVEMEEDDDVGEALEAVEGLGEFGEDLDLAGGPLEEPRRREGRRRELGRFLVARADDADGPEADSGPYFPTYVSHFS